MNARFARCFLQTVGALATILAAWLVCLPPTLAATAEDLFETAFAIMETAEPTRSDQEEALGKMEEAAGLRPEVFKYAYNAGYINARLSRWAAAEGWFEKARQLATTDADRADTDVWLKLCTEKRFQREFEEGGEGGGESRMLLAYSLKSEGLGGEEHRDRLRTAERLLPKVTAGSDDDAALRRFFEERFAGLHTLRREDFLIVGFGDDEELGDHYQRGLKDAYRVFRTLYFPEGPREVISVLVDGQAHRLTEIVNTLYPDTPVDVYAPYLGLYNATDNLVVATVGGGYGTLLHELMHALVAADYPDCPAWLGEAMATMYERSRWTPSRLVPLPNWRMHFVSEDTVPGLADFDTMLDREIKDKHDLANLRLFMLFLDDHGRVGEFYNARKRQGESFSVAGTLAGWGPAFANAEWQRFARGMISGYRAELSRDRGTPTFGETLFVQRALNRILDAGLAEDGVWGSATEAKVRQFQERFGLEVDGKVGRKTRAALQREFAQRQE